VELSEIQKSLTKLAVFLFALVLSFFNIEKIRWLSYIGNGLSLYTGFILISQVPMYIKSVRY